MTVLDRGGIVRLKCGFLLPGQMGNTYVLPIPAEHTTDHLFEDPKTNMVYGLHHSNGNAHHVTYGDGRGKTLTRGTASGSCSQNCEYARTRQAFHFQDASGKAASICLPRSAGKPRLRLGNSCRDLVSITNGNGSS